MITYTTNKKLLSKVSDVKIVRIIKWLRKRQYINVNFHPYDSMPPISGVDYSLEEMDVDGEVKSLHNFKYFLMKILSSKQNEKVEVKSWPAAIGLIVGSGNVDVDEYSEHVLNWLTEYNDTEGLPISLRKMLLTARMKGSQTSSSTDDSDTSARRMTIDQFSERRPIVEAALKYEVQGKQRLLKLWASIRKDIQDKQYDEVDRKLSGLDDLTNEVQRNIDALRKASRNWVSARVEVQKTLENIRGVIIANAEHPDTRIALIKLKATQSQLTLKLRTQSSVLEMERYLKTNDVIDDICGQWEDIRKPLLLAISPLKTILQ